MSNADAIEVSAAAETDGCADCRQSWAKLRELVWRAEQVAKLLISRDRALDDRTLAAMLDTTDARVLFEGRGAEPLAEDAPKPVS